MIEQQPPPRGRRRLLLAGSGLIGVVLGVLLLVTASSGEGDDVALRIHPRPERAPGTTQTSSTTRPGDDSGLALDDPFHQIVTVPEAPGGQDGQALQPVQPSAAGAAPEGPGEAPAPSSTSADETDHTPEVPSQSAPSEDEGTTYISLELFSISRDGTGVERAELSVDGRYYSPTDGEVFSGGLRLEINGDCVEVWAGSERADMCLPPPPSPAPAAAPASTTTTVTSPIGTGSIVTAEGAFLQPPPRTFPRSTEPANATCRALSAPGWTIDDCAEVGMAEGSRVWLLESRPATASQRLGAIERRATVLHWSPDAGAWVVDLSFRDAVAAGVGMSVKAADLTGDGLPEMVFGFRGLGARALLTYDVVVTEPGMRVIVAASRDIYGGRVSLAGGVITDYEARYANGEPSCCPAYMQRSVVTFSRGVFRMVEAGRVAVSELGPVDF